jgi:hypothetical protein
MTLQAAQASCLVCRRVFDAPDLAPHWARHRPETVQRAWAATGRRRAAPPPPSYPCRHCAAAFDDVAAWRCHVVAEHLHPEQAHQVRLQFLKHRHALAHGRVPTHPKEEAVCP